MISQFDHRFGTYEGQTQAQKDLGKLPELTEEQHCSPSQLPLPQYWVHKSDLPAFMHDKINAFIVFRDIARSTDNRTAIFCILPSVPCSNNLPVVLVDKKYSREIVFLSAATSSFVFDYIAKQKVGGTHMNFFIVKQFPVLPPEQYETICRWDSQVSLGDWIWPRALELTYTAWDLEPFAKDCGYDGPPFCWDEERRFLLRCELGAAYFHLYGIARDDVDYIMDTFRVWREKEEKLCGEYHTKRVILEIYDELQRAIESGVPYRTRLEPGSADAAVAHAARGGVGV